MKFLILGLLPAVVACKDGARPRRDDARAPTHVSRLLRYQPANLPPYRIVTTVKPASAEATTPVDITLVLDVELAGDSRTLRATFKDKEPLAGAGLLDMARATVLLFPELPEEPVYRGDEWTVGLHVRVHGYNELLRLSHVLRYAGEVSCPKRVGTCTQLEVVDFLNRRASVRGKDSPWFDVLSFKGSVILDIERGIVAEARLNVTATVVNGPDNVPVNATVVATPAPRS